MLVTANLPSSPASPPGWAARLPAVPPPLRHADPARESPNQQIPAANAVSPTKDRHTDEAATLCWAATLARAELAGTPAAARRSSSSAEYPPAKAGAVPG